MNDLGEKLFQRKEMIEVEATVVRNDSYESNAGRGKRTVYQPTFEYQWNGWTRSYTPEYWFSGSNYQVGDKITLLVNAKDSSDIRVKDITKDPKAFLVGIVIFLIFVILSSLLSGCGAKNRQEVPEQITSQGQDLSGEEKEDTSGKESEGTSENENAHILYQKFLDGEISCITAKSFEEDDKTFNEDGLLFGSYSYQETEEKIAELFQGLTDTYYTCLDLDQNGIEELVIRFDNDAYPEQYWVGVIRPVDDNLELASYYSCMTPEEFMLYQDGALDTQLVLGAYGHRETFYKADQNCVFKPEYKLYYYQASGVTDLAYELSDSWNHFEQYFEVGEEFSVLAYVADGTVKISPYYSENPDCKALEEALIEEFVTLGAQVASDEEILALCDQPEQRDNYVEWNCLWRDTDGAKNGEEPSENMEDELVFPASAIHVNTTEELLNAIAPNTYIVLEPGYYNMSTYLQTLEYEMNEFGEKQYPWNDTHPYVQISEVFDGEEFVIKNVSGLTIVGNTHNESEVHLVVEPRYATCMTFDHCNTVTLSSFMMGHTKTGDCAGDVIALTYCKDMNLNSLNLYGCGVNGLNATYCEGYNEIYMCNIHDCSDFSFLVRDCTGDFRFAFCRFWNSGFGNVIEGARRDFKPSFYSCYFDAREAESMMWRDGIELKDCILEEPNMEFEYPDVEEGEGDEGYDPNAYGWERFTYNDERLNNKSLDLTPIEGQFMEVSEEGMPRESAEGTNYGFSQNLTDGCSEWCAIDDYSHKEGATSTLNPQGQYSYAAQNVADFSLDTAWVEGSDGDGIGESIWITKRYMTSEYYGRYDSIFFTNLCFVNGLAKNETAWKKNSRVKKLNFYFNEEFVGEIELLDTRRPQYISLNGAHLSAKDYEEVTFRFEIAEVYPGSVYQDTAITGIDIEFYTDNH